MASAAPPSADFAHFLGRHAVHDGDCSHTSFAGGKFNIPEGHRVEFVRLYCADVFTHGRVQHLNERVNGKPFRLYFDVDFKSVEQFEAVCALLGLADESAFLNILVQSISEHAFTIYHDDDDPVEDGRLKEMVVSKRIGLSGKYHVNLPGIIVDRGMAQYLATAASQCLLGKFNRRHDDVDLVAIPGMKWADVFDTGVYASGLRVLGSRKTGAGDLGYEILEGGGENAAWTAVQSPHPKLQFERTMVLPDLTNARERMLFAQVTEENRFQGAGMGTFEDTSGGGLIRTGGITEPSEVLTVVEYVASLRENAATKTGAIFHGFGLVISKVSRIVNNSGSSGGRGSAPAALAGYFVTLKDRVCPFKNGEHKRKTAYLYLSINRQGCFMHCFDESCAKKHFPTQRVPVKGADILKLVGVVPDKRAKSKMEIEALNSKESRERSIRNLGGDPDAIFRPPVVQRPAAGPPATGSTGQSSRGGAARTAAQRAAATNSTDGGRLLPFLSHGGSRSVAAAQLGGSDDEDLDDGASEDDAIFGRRRQREDTDDSDDEDGKEARAMRLSHRRRRSDSEMEMEEENDGSQEEQPFVVSPPRRAVRRLHDEGILDDEGPVAEEEEGEVVDEDMVDDFPLPPLATTMTKRGACADQVMTPEDRAEHRFFSKDLRINCDFKRDAMLYQCMIGAMSGTNWDIANLAFYVFNRIYRVDKADKSTWYSFSKHRWSIKVQTLQIHVSECLIALLFFWRKVMVATGEMDLEHKPTNERFESLIVKAKTHQFKAAVTKDCAMLFAREFPDFQDSLDASKHRLGFKNGVFDFKERRFRDGVPEDKLSLSCSVEYVSLETADPGGQIRSDIEEFVASIFTNAETCEWIWELMSRIVHGRMREEFVILTGSGSNGKSKLVSLLQGAMGELAADLPIAYITNKRNKSSAAAPEFIRTKGKRFVVTTEPEDDAKLNLGLVKNMVGNDMYSGRDLYQSQTEFVPQFHFWMLCNNLPVIEATDEGAWRRLLIVELQTRFVDVPNPENPLEKAIDPLLEAKIAGWHQVFILMLVERFLRTGSTRLDQCEEVKNATKEIQFEFNHMASFVGNLEKDPAPNTRLEFDFIERHYKDFCIGNNVKNVRGYLLKRALRDKFGPPFENPEKILLYKLRWKAGSPYAGGGIDEGGGGRGGGGPLANQM